MRACEPFLLSRRVRNALLVVSAFIWLGAIPAQSRELTPRESHALGEICLRCHAQSNVAAPLMGDADAWSPRVSQGLDQMLANTVLGVGEMPPLGTCGYCTEEELLALIVVLSGTADHDSGEQP